MMMMIKIMRIMIINIIIYNFDVSIIQLRLGLPKPRAYIEGIHSGSGTAVGADCGAASNAA